MKCLKFGIFHIEYIYTYNYRKILKKLKSWDLGEHKSVSRLIDTLDLAHFSLKTRSFILELAEDDPIEIVLKSKRRIGLKYLQSDQESAIKRYYSSPQILEDQVFYMFYFVF